MVQNLQALERTHSKISHNNNRSIYKKRKASQPDFIASLESAKLKDELDKAKKFNRGKASDLTLIGDPVLSDFIPNRYEEPEVPKPQITIV